MGFDNIWLTIGLVHLLAIACPGPDTALLTQTAIRHGRSAALRIALGLTFGLLLHLAWASLGVNIIMEQLPYLGSSLKWLGVGYLIFLAIQMIRSSLKDIGAEAAIPPVPMGGFALRGFLTNISNPKAILYFSALLSQLDFADISSMQRLGLCAEIFVISIVWFFGTAYTLSMQKFRQSALAPGKNADLVIGLALLVISVTLVFEI